LNEKTAGFNGLNGLNIHMVIGNIPRQREGDCFQACPYSQEGATIPGVVEEMKFLPAAGFHRRPSRSYCTAKSYYMSLLTAQVNGNVHQKNPVLMVYQMAVPRQFYQGLHHAACQVCLTETVLRMAEAHVN
jgi:hypothetical protein